MNRFFALKYNTAQKQFVPVAEICHKKSKSATKVKRSAKAGRAIFYNLLLLLTAVCSNNSQASIVNGAYDYQTYRDFAENKGQFKPGATNIKIYKRDNTSGKPDIVLSQPMPDFSGLAYHGYVTLVAPAYIVSVKHNSGYQSFDFGNPYDDLVRTTYNIVNRNEEATQDFHAPRVDKFVVDAAPVNLLPIDLYSEPRGLISNKARFPIGVRLGAGTQRVRTRLNGREVTEYIAGGYNYLTGGTVNKIFYWGRIAGQNTNVNNVLDTTAIQQGDSGSPLFVWDNETNQWEVAGVASTGNNYSGNWSVVNIRFLQDIMKKDIDEEVTLNGATAYWRSNALVNSRDTWRWTGITETRKELKDTKHLVFSGGGEVVLTQNINQGAGGIFFDQNQHYSFISGKIRNKKTDYNWQGAGLDIGKGTVVDWNISGIRNDYLHKIGEGRLNVNAYNRGNLRLGDGVVALNTPFAAFYKIILVSGRGTLLINNEDSFRPDTTHFYERGGTLDMNGHNVLFKWIYAMDIGAHITNSNSKLSTVTIAPVTDHSVRANRLDPADVNITDSNTSGFLYVYKNPNKGTTDFFIKKGAASGNFPSNHTSNTIWEYVGHDEEQAKNIVRSRRPKENYIFHGTISGNTDTHVDTTANTGEFSFDGTINTPQNILSAEGKTLTFQGHPVIHAYNTQYVADRLKELGDNSVKTQPVSFHQPDWETRSFSLRQLKLTNTEFHLARNANLSADIDASGTKILLGSPELFIDLKDGETVYGKYIKGTSVATNNKDMSFYRGTVNLENHSMLDIREKFSGSISATDSVISVLSPAEFFRGDEVQLTNSKLNIRHSSPKNNMQEYTISRLIANNSTVTLSTAAASGWAAHRLTVDTLNASNVIFDLNARVRTGESDSIFITKQALGGDNRLDVHFLLTNEAPLFSQDLLLASAPEATPDNYFTVNPLSSGLTLFIPNSKISSEGGKKQWLLSLTKPAGSAATETSDKAVTAPAVIETIAVPVANNIAVAPVMAPAVRKTAAAPVVNDTVVEPATTPAVSDTAAAPVVNETAAEPATTPAVSDTAAAPVVSDTAIAPATTPAVTATVPEPAPAAAQPPITENNQPQPATALFNPFTLKLADLDRATDENYLHQLLQQAGINASPQQIQQYQQLVAHTASVVKNVETLASLPNVAFVLETNQLNKRLGDVRQLGEDQGLWVKTSAGRASYQALDLRHTTLQLGVDKKIDNHLFGIMGSYTRGSSQGATSSEKHTTAGAALYYSWVPDQGMFVDVIGKYLRNHQHFTFPTDAAIAEQFPRSTTLLGSVQLGYLAKFNNAGNFNNASNNSLFIEPSIELLAGHTSGYRMNGRDFSIQVKNSNPVYSKIGVAAGYQWQFAPQRAISVSASLYRLQNLHRGGAVELIGSGSNNRRIQQAAWDNRYLANFSVNARLSENWRIYSQLETSFAGQLKKDISGQIALRYQF